MRYLYKCDQEKCQSEFEAFHSMKGPFLKKCPYCGQDSLATVIHNPHVFVRGEALTIAMLADRNTKALGHQGREEMWGKQTEAKQLATKSAREELADKLPRGSSLPDLPTTDTPWFRPGTKTPLTGLADLTIQQKKKYIEKGETP
jgi:putative FmdB family regulatory protein